MNAETKPRVLIVYYTFTKQTGLVVEAMAKQFAERGCDVTTALLEFTDPHHGKKFSTLPMHWPVVKIVSMLPAQARRKTGEIGIPPEAQAGDYDLVVFGSPTWWLTTNMPVRSYLESPAAKQVLDGKPFAAASISRRYWKGNINGIRTLGERSGGTWVDQTHFVAAGNQVDVDDLLARLHVLRRAQGALPRHPAAEAEPEARLRGAGARLRQPPGGQRGSPARGRLG